ncbi:hypothetical protein BOTNAR_0287g00120 [Botryotinia narcissicola]|uniref:Uncharacterized protein n=1 Tax=Botryotinia narcissicola TaxID=278944 RepID=A0A4Z1I2W5_9HELO|nr:hypothetical protein BOTNAR_0287g00120 [Botryotinia narcissicola]
MGDFDGLDLEDAKKSQEAADAILAQTREDFVQKFSDEERANGRLRFKRVRELSEDADYAEAYRRAKINEKECQWRIAHVTLTWRIALTA